MMRNEIEYLRLAIRRALIQLTRGEDEPSIADDPQGAAESINEARSILREALKKCPP